MSSKILLKEVPIIIVMPFENKTGNDENNSISERISEEISSALTDSVTISVISYYSALYFQQQQYSISDIAKKVEIDYLVTGNLYQSEENFRLSIQLTESATEEQIWAKKIDFNREIKDINSLILSVVEIIQISVSQS